MTVSVIIPCRNEEHYIAACLDSVLANDLPSGSKLEIIIADGMSDDNTRAVVRRYVDQHPFIRLIDNPRRIVPTALNAAIRASSGEIIIRMDAHNTYRQDYIARCIHHLLSSGADNVGGIWITVPGAETTTAKAIAAALSHPFGAGNAHYRVGTTAPRYVDTVPFGCFRRSLFDRIGFFDEDLVRNQDDEFNSRILKNNGRILLAPDIVSVYHARPTLGRLGKLYYQYGLFKPLAARKAGTVVTWRQLVPPALVLSLAGSFVLAFLYPLFLWLFIAIIAPYGLATAAASIQTAYRSKAWNTLAVLPLVFWTLHFSYGMGYMKGLWAFLVHAKKNKGKITDMPLTR